MLQQSAALAQLFSQDNASTLSYILAGSIWPDAMAICFGVCSELMELHLMYYTPHYKMERSVPSGVLGKGKDNFLDGVSSMLPSIALIQNLITGSIMPQFHTVIDN
eukprot:3261774-Ditylum_brightwellii.AAC.1